MTRKRKQRSRAGRVPLEMLPEQERQRRTSLGKRKPLQRSVYEKTLHEDGEVEKTDAQSPVRRSRLKSDPKAVAEQSQQLLQSESDEQD